METLDQMIESLAKEIKKNIKSLSGIKNIDQRKTQAEIVKLLCESLGVFFTAIAATRSADTEYDDDFYEADHYDEDDEYYDEDDDDAQFEADMKKVPPPKKKKKGKKTDDDDIPF